MDAIIGTLLIDPYLQKFTYEETTNHRNAKVYRKTYSHNNHPKDEKNYVPHPFNTPFNKDVTDLYYKTKDIRIPIHLLKAQHNPEYAYLGVFNKEEWVPVAWGEIKNRKVVFAKMGIDILYQPIYFEGNRERSAGYPFVLNNDGRIDELKPDTTKLEEIKFYRKYPLTDYSHIGRLAYIMQSGLMRQQEHCNTPIS